MSKRIITFGTWEGESIEWIILKEEKYGILALSKKILFNSIFDQDSNNWTTSYICKFLNNDFFNKSFTEKEKMMIVNASIGENIDDISDYFVEHNWSNDFYLSEIPGCKCNVFY